MTAAQPQPQISGGFAAAPAAPTGGLPLSHRLSIVYLAVPVVVWLVGWFEWWIGLPVAGLLVAGLWGALSGSWRISLTLPVLVSLLVALAWMLLTPISGLWAASMDLKLTFDVLLEIGRGEWPTYATDYLNDYPPLLSYYLGFTMVPGLVGRWLGSATLSWALPLYTWIGIGLVIIVFTRGLTTLRTLLLSIVVLVFFSGMEVLEFVLHLGPLDAWDFISSRLRRNIPLHRLFPTTSRLYPTFLPYTIDLWGTTQHVIASALVTVIMIQSRHQPRFAAISGLVMTICLFWSPMSAIGLLPLAAALVIQKGVKPFLKWPNLLAAPPLISLIAIFLTNNDLPSHFGWLWQSYANLTEMLVDLMWGYLTEFILLAIVLILMNRQIIKNPIFIASLAVLLAAPLLLYNPEAIYGLYGDTTDIYYIMWRGTVPALVALAYFTARTLTDRLPEMTRRTDAASSPVLPSNLRWLTASLIVILAVGALTPLSAFFTSTNQPHTIYERTERTLLTHKPQRHDAQRIMTSVPGLLQVLLRESSQKGLSIGDLIIRSKYDIYLQPGDNNLVYLNRNCIPESEKATRFFLHIFPTNGDDLSIARQEVGYDIKEARWDFYTQGTNGCIAIFGLPDYDIARIVTGQYTPYLGIEWSVEYQFNDRDGIIANHIHRFDPTDTYQAYHSYYQLVIANKPLIQSTFNVHPVPLHNNTLAYVKDHCTSQDAQTPFFLHIIPADANDLPVHRQESGFDNYDFLFSEQGTIFDDRCLAIIPIPDYDIATIRTGQFDPTDGRHFWQEEATLDR